MLGTLQLKWLLLAPGYTWNLIQMPYAKIWANLKNSKDDALLGLLFHCSYIQ